MTKASDLRAEMYRASNLVREEHFVHLAALGVSAQSLARVSELFPAFGVNQIVSERSRLYHPGRGAAHVIMPVVDQGEIIDLIAWRSATPARWYCRTGAGWALGTEYLLPRWDDEPVRLFSTPLEWLAAGGRGICILDWSAPEVRQLAALDTIEADEFVGRKLGVLLSKPIRIPRICVREVVRHEFA